MCALEYERLEFYKLVRQLSGIVSYAPLFIVILFFVDVHLSARVAPYSKKNWHGFYQV